MEKRDSFWKKRIREIGLMLCDAVIMLLCVYAAMLLRFAPNIQADDMRAVSRAMPGILLVYLIVFSVFRMYRTLWRYAETLQYVRQAMATVVGFGVIFLINELLQTENGEVPLSRYYLVTEWMFTLVGIIGFRVALRALKLYYTRGEEDKRKGERRILLICCEKTAVAALDMLEKKRQVSGVKLIVDEDATHQGFMFRGIPISGTYGDIERLCREEEITDIYIRLPEVPETLPLLCLETGCYVRYLY